MSLPSKNPALVWDITGYDALQIIGPGGNVLSWIDATGTPQGNLGVSSFSSLSLVMKHIRFNYTVTSDDVSNGLIGPVGLSWGTPFSDTNYTVAFTTVLVSTAGNSNSATYGPNGVANITVSGLTASVFVDQVATAGDVIQFNIIGIHD
jgi:hypothetical protein